MRRDKHVDGFTVIRVSVRDSKRHTVTLRKPTYCTTHTSSPRTRELYFLATVLFPRSVPQNKALHRIDIFHVYCDVGAGLIVARGYPVRSGNGLSFTNSYLGPADAIFPLYAWTQFEFGVAQIDSNFSLSI